MCGVRQDRKRRVNPTEVGTHTNIHYNRTILYTVFLDYKASSIQNTIVLALKNLNATLTCYSCVVVFEI